MNRARPTNVPTEIKVALPADVHRDLQALAKASGLATSTYVRSMIIAHLAKVYRVTEQTDDR